MSAAKKKPKPGGKSRILLVDDHRMVLNGYQLMLDAEPDLVVCAPSSRARVHDYLGGTVRGMNGVRTP